MLRTHTDCPITMHNSSCFPTSSTKFSTFRTLCTTNVQIYHLFWELHTKSYPNTEIHAPFLHYTPNLVQFCTKFIADWYTLVFFSKITSIYKASFPILFLTYNFKMLAESTKFIYFIIFRKLIVWILLL